MLRGGDGRRVPIQIAVESVSDGLVTETFTGTDLENGLHDRATHRVGSQDMLGGSLLAASGDRVRNLIRQIPVRGASDVEALFGVDFEPAPGFLQHLQDVPLGHALLHPPREHLGRAFPVQGDRFIGRPQRDAELLQSVLDLGADVGPTRDPVDRLADHRIEPPIDLGRFHQQVLNTAVTRNRNVEPLVPAPEPASGEVLAPGLDVVEVRDDHRTPRKCCVQGVLAVGELTRKRQRRILLVLG
ncbi:hypothetical protein [Actinomadura darangshiensis]|uniref:hypothetical protein n=1 Tax=Actinomadura darangshiensis TaxID=705336 RepID=UPI001FB7E83A|nr:hypothetical protein [Actinomadura darangshiensis]